MRLIHIAYALLIFSGLSACSASKRMSRICKNHPNVCVVDTTTKTKRFRDTVTVVTHDTVVTVDSTWKLRRKYELDSVASLAIHDTLIIRNNSVITKIIRLNNDSIRIYQEYSDSILEINRNQNITINTLTTIRDSLERELWVTRTIKASLLDRLLQGGVLPLLLITILLLVIYYKLK